MSNLFIYNGREWVEISKDGTEITANEVALKLESLEGDDRLDISAIKGAEEMVDDIATSIVKAEIKKIPKPTVYMGSRGSSSSSGGVQSVVAGTNVTVDNTDPSNPIVSATGGGAVDSVNGQTGVVILDTGDIADTTNARYVTDADLVVIGNTSGVNTGDNATNSQYSGLATSKQDTLVSGTNIKTINGNSLLGSGDLVISGGGGSLTKGIAEVDFGDYTVYNDIATVSVLDASVTSTSYPSVSMYAFTTTDHDPDDYMAEGLIPYVTNVVNGVGFDISVRAPSLTWGKYKVSYQF